MSDREQILVEHGECHFRMQKMRERIAELETTAEAHLAAYIRATETLRSYLRGKHPSDREAYLAALEASLASAKRLGSSLHE